MMNEPLTLPAQPVSPLTPEEYLELERQSPVKHEYYRRTMYAMAGGAKRANEPSRLYPFGYNQSVKPVSFLGDSLQCLRDFPEDARHDAGYQLEKVQRGEQPDDFKPMPAIGKGVEEIRVADESGAYRVIYVARLAEAVYVLHAFQKKTQATSKRDIETAKKRLAQLSGGGK